MNSNTHYMKRCLELALQGLGSVAPNPMVGCVIVRDDQIISEGFHQKFGEAHAEVNAIGNLPSDLNFSDCTLYVNLEPCSHQGKTPPCSDRIISKKFKKVVIGNIDVNPLVSGKGIEKIKKAGIEVEQGILNEECHELNKRFFTFHEKKRPYIILKWAQTSDGFIGKIPFVSKEDNWITGNESKTLVHQWRSQEQAVMVGTNTVITDDPELTTRLVKGNNPIRIILDKDLKISTQAKVFNKEAQTIVFTSKEKNAKENVNYIKIDFSNDVSKQIVTELYKKNISSVLVEGGSKLLQTFINENLWDEARVFVNPNKKFINGVKAPSLVLNTYPQMSGEDQLYVVNRNKKL